MKKNDYIINPKTGTPIFGTIPLIQNKSYTFPEGDIFLKYGVHQKVNRGFGAIHIWKEHENEILAMGYEASEKIALTAHFVSDILQSGTKIYCEFSRQGKERLTVLKRNNRVVIIEHLHDGNYNTVYSVVSAYKLTRRKPHGQLIGNLK